MNQLKSRIVSSLSPDSPNHRSSDVSVQLGGAQEKKFRVPPLCAKPLSNTLPAAHLTFISLMFDKCLSTTAAGAHAL